MSAERVAATDGVAPWMLTFAFVAVTAAVSDYVAGGRALQPTGLASVVGLALGSGAAQGIALGSVLRGVSTVPLAGLRIGAWALVSALPFLWLAISLDAFGNLGGRYNTLAVAILAACAASTLGATLLFATLQPSRAGPALLPRQRAGVRVSAAGVLLAAFAVTTWGDRTQFTGQYESAHVALALAGLIAASVAVRLLLPLTLPRRRLGKALLLVPALLVLVPFATMRSQYSAVTTAIVERPLAAIHLQVLRTLTDVDLDGYSALLGGGDCAPFDGDMSPGARDVPGNGVDEDCGGGDATSSDDAAALPPIPDVPSPVNVVLVTIDTVRPDHMSVYGYGRKTTPRIERWAKKATRFDDAYTSGGWTSLAVPSLHRGVYPRRLRWDRMVETNKYRYRREPATDLRDGEKIRARFLLPIDDPRPTLAELLKRRGMHTMAAVDGGFTEVLADKWGAGTGFSQFVEVRGLKQRGHRNDRGTADQAIRLLERRPKGKRFFLWAHFFGPHGPSSKHKGIASFGTASEDGYDHEILFADGHVGRLLEAVERKVREPTLVILTSDHGETLRARKRKHGTDMSEDCIRIPLLARGPGFAGEARVKGLVSLVDVAPTILAATRTPPPRVVDGVDLYRAAKGDVEGRTVFVDNFALDRSGSGFKRDWIAAVHGEHKLVLDRLRGTTVLSLRSDPDYPPANLIEDYPDSPLLEAVDRHLKDVGGAPTVNAIPTP